MKNLKPQNSTQNKKPVVRVEQRVVRQGPLPTPEDFAAYGLTLPDAPERILTMAENRSNAFIAEETRAGKRDFITTMVVIGCTMFIIIFAFGAGIFFIITGNVAVGVGTMLSSAFFLWRTFLRSFFSQSK